MKFSNRKHAFISNLAAFGAAMFFCLGASLFAVVWQHQDNVRIARENNILENRIASLQRHQTELSNKIASEQTLEVLNRRNVEFRLNLASVREQQIVRVTKDPKMLLDMKRNAERIGLLPDLRTNDAAPLARPAAAAQPSLIRFVSVGR